MNIARRELGQGLGGAVVYLAQHLSNGTKGALKWPVGQGELEALKSIQESAVENKALARLGLPRLLASGMHEGRPFIVTELLGSDLAKLFDRLQDHPLEARWRAVCVLGRMVLRRLQVLHDTGFVHCDFSPLNVLMGPAPGNEGVVLPYLIDFGLARRFPGGAPLRGDKTTLEFSSIRSAKGGIRWPEDDLEGLGWTLMCGGFGELPWFNDLDGFNKLPAPDKERVQAHLTQQVRKAKENLLDEGWRSLGEEWSKFQDIPSELHQFLAACRVKEDDASSGPDYTKLQGLLGGNLDLNQEEAEKEDMRQYAAHVAPLL